MGKRGGIANQNTQGGRKHELHSQGTMRRGTIRSHEGKEVGKEEPERQQGKRAKRGQLSRQDEGEGPGPLV